MYVEYLFMQTMKQPTVELERRSNRAIWTAHPVEHKKLDDMANARAFLSHATLVETVAGGRVLYCSGAHSNSSCRERRESRKPRWFDLDDGHVGVIESPARAASTADAAKKTGGDRRGGGQEKVWEMRKHPICIFAFALSRTSHRHAFSRSVYATLKNFYLVSPIRFACVAQNPIFIQMRVFQ